eukprot:gene37761-10267_t
MGGQPSTELTRFDPCDLHRGMVYHRVYHYSLALHLNHLAFLNTYLFGVAVLLAASRLWEVPAGVGGCYAVWMVAVTRGRALPYAAVVGGIGYGAWAAHAALLHRVGAGWAGGADG